MKHKWETCPVPICIDDKNKNYKKEVLWYPGETICSHRPYQKFQRRQERLNEELKRSTLENPKHYWTAEMLEDDKTFMGRMGGNPDTE